MAMVDRFKRDGSRPMMGMMMSPDQLDLLDNLNTLQAILKDYFQGEESVDEVRMQIARYVFATRLLETFSLPLVRYKKRQTC
jgi:hypothetical protein